jgi:hypothetical protein
MPFPKLGAFQFLGEKGDNGANQKKEGEDETKSK